MATNRPLPGDITVTGVDQASLVKWMQNVTDGLNELIDDHATFKTVVDELVTDHATTKTTVDAARTAIIELSDDHDTNQTHLTNLKALLNQSRQVRLYGVFGNPGFAIDTNFDIKNGTAVYYTNGGTLKTLAANANFDTGTVKTIAGSQWAAAVLSVNASGTGIVTWTATAASEAAALALVAAPTATETLMGYAAVQAHASGFTAGTDALTTGTGGNVATTTTDYYTINPNAAMLAAAVSTSAEAALTASDPAAGPATLSAAGPATLSDTTDITLLRS